MEIQPYNNPYQQNSDLKQELDTKEIVSEVTMAFGDEKRNLSQNQKRILSKLYKVGNSIQKTHSNHAFQTECIDSGVNPKFSWLQRRQFLGAQDKLAKVSQKITEAAKEHFEDKLEELKPKLEDLKCALKRTSTEQVFVNLLARF